MRLSLADGFLQFRVCLFFLCKTLNFCFGCHQEALGREIVSDCVRSFTQMLLPVLLGLPKSINPTEGDTHLRKHCARITGVSRLLLDILPLSSTCCFSVRPACFLGLNSFTPVCCGLHKIFGVPGGQRRALPRTGGIPALLLS